MKRVNDQNITKLVLWQTVQNQIKLYSMKHLFRAVLLIFKKFWFGLMLYVQFNCYGHVWTFFKKVIIMLVIPEIENGLAHDDEIELSTIQ